MVVKVEVIIIFTTADFKLTVKMTITDCLLYEPVVYNQ